MINKKTTITTLILITSLSLVFSGCLKKEPIANTNTNQEDLPSEASAQEEEIDTSTWKTYRNEEYGFEFKYPEDWVKFEYQDKLNNLIVSMENKEFKYPYGSDGDIRFFVRIYKSDFDFKEWFEKEGLYGDNNIKEKINFMKKEVSDDSIGMDDVIIRDYNLNFKTHNAIVRYVKFLKPEYYEGPAYTHKIYNFEVNDYVVGLELSSPTSVGSDELIDKFDKSIISTISFF